MRQSRRAIVALLLVIAGALTPLIAHAIGGRCWIFLADGSCTCACTCTAHVKRARQPCTSTCA